MWKIERTTDGQRVVFVLSGCIETEHVAKLQRLFALETEGVSFVR
jgi:hypothetical protein